MPKVCRRYAELLTVRSERNFDARFKSLLPRVEASARKEKIERQVLRQAFLAIQNIQYALTGKQFRSIVILYICN
jgi:hypothetical protein